MTAKSGNHPFRKRYVLAAALAALLLFLILFLYFFWGKNLKAKYYDLWRLSSSSYTSVFFSMYPIGNFNEEDFATFHAWSCVLSSYQIPDSEALSDYLTAALSSGNAVTDICLGLDPYQLWKTSDMDMDQWEQQLDGNVLPFFREHPDIHFEVLLPYPSLDYWCGLGGDGRAAALDSYSRVIAYCDTCPNVTAYFMGGEQWLISNPGNYEKPFLTNPLVSQKILLFTFCDHAYQITSINMGILFDRLTSLVEQEETSPAVYPDLSEWQMVFFGDSVIGNYAGSFAVPGVVTGLSGAATYNYAIGGTQAADMENYDSSFTDVVETFLQKQRTPTLDSPAFPYSGQYPDGDHLCFLMHYGLNDYFSGRPVDNASDPYDNGTFAGALRNGVRELSEACPNSLIILMTPPFCAYYSYGTEMQSDAGGVLTDYVDAVIRVAESENVVCMNNYEGLGITADNFSDYLADGCHLNETGRYLLGTQIISLVEEHLDDARN